MKLPTIQPHQDLVQAVDAKELYQSLGLNSAHWAKWHARNIDSNDFAVEGVDYQTFTQWVRGNATKNYMLTIDFAKKIAMQVKTETGERIRNYFLECERQAMNPAVKPQFSIPQTLSEALRLAADQAEQIEEQQARLAMVEPKAAALDVIDSAMGSLGVRETAKTIGIKQNKFVAWCINNNWMYRDNKNKLQPYSNRIQQGYMEQRPVTFNARNGESRATIQPMFTPKGLARLAQIFAVVHEVA